MNKETLRALVKNIDSDLFELINHVICSICQELLTRPVTTPCGHSFCSGCIKRVVSSRDNSGCPLCKNPVKRYSLETDKVKSTLTEIFRELPAAFEKDVQDLSATLNETTDDLVKSSKLAQLSNQDYEKNAKSNKRRAPLSRKPQKSSDKSENTEANNCEVDSFVPVLKRSKNVIEYASAKKKRADDLVSISQREVESDPGVCDTSGLDKKLEQIEKVSPEEKINDWFKAAGSNIYLGSPGTNYLDSPPMKNPMSSQGPSKDDRVGCSNTSPTVRRYINKVWNPSHSEENEEESGARVVDPYEFIPSQNKKIGKRKKGRKCQQKKIPDFKALQSFSKESVKRNKVVLEEDAERENETEVSKSSGELPAVARTPDVITASQKFDKLLCETKESEKKESAKAHVLYSASQASSAQFLDCSYQSPVPEVKKVPRKRRSRVGFKKARKSISPGEEDSISNLTPNRTRCSNARSERKESLDGGEAKAEERQSFSEVMNLMSEEALDLEKSVEEYLIKFKKVRKSSDKGTSSEKTSPPTKRKLELVNNNDVYRNHPKNAQAEVKERRSADQKESERTSCENTSHQSKTKLMELLEELSRDGVIYKNHPRNAPVELKNQRKADGKGSEGTSSGRTFQQTKMKLVVLLEKLIIDDVMFKNHSIKPPVEVENGRKSVGKDSEVGRCENSFHQTKTKLMELLEELIKDEVVYKNHPRSASVELKNQTRTGEKYSEVGHCENAIHQVKTKLTELLDELVKDDVVYKNHPRNAPVEAIDKRNANEKGSEVGVGESSPHQTRTKLTGLMGELAKDETVYGNHPKNSQAEVRRRRKSEGNESEVGNYTHQVKTKLTELLEELVKDDVVYKNHPRDLPVDLKNRRTPEEDPEVASCENTFQQTQTKTIEPPEELVSDDVVSENHPKDASVDPRSRRETEAEEIISVVTSLEETSQQTKTKLTEVLEEPVEDDVVSENHPKDASVDARCRRETEDGEIISKVTSLEETSQQTKTKLTEVLEELVGDDVVSENHPKDAPVDGRSRRETEDEEIISKVTSFEETSQQTKTKLMELPEEPVEDDVVSENHPTDVPMDAGSRREAEDGEINPVVSPCEESSQQTETRSTEVLEELVEDDVVSKNHPRNGPLELKNRRQGGDRERPTLNKSSPSSSNHTSHKDQVISYNSQVSDREDTSKPIDDLKSGTFTQGTHLLGFSTQEELVDEKMFKEMVKNMERELELSESDLERCNERKNESSTLNSSYESDSSNSKLSRNVLPNSNFIKFNCLGKIRRQKSCFINFLHLGRLTPVKRSRSSVVKLVFPIGLSSFAKRRVVQDKRPEGIHSSKFPPPTPGFRNETSTSWHRNEQVSTGIQTSQRLVSYAEIETPRFSKSVNVQTSQLTKPSVEIQTVGENCCVEVQTSQVASPQKYSICNLPEMQTSQQPCDSCRSNPNDAEYIPGWVGCDEPEILPNRNTSRDFEDGESSFRKLRSTNERAFYLEGEDKETSHPSGLSSGSKRMDLSPTRKLFYKHKKISRRTFEEEESCSIESRSPEKIGDVRSQEKPCSGSLVVVDSEMKREFDETWVRKSQNERSKEAVGLSQLSERLSPVGEEQNSPAYSSQNLSGLIDQVLQKFETRQRIPLDVRKVSSDDYEYEMIDLATPENARPTSQDQVSRVLKNIDLDLGGKANKGDDGRRGTCVSENLGNKDEKSEEDDSDFFVEQTPPRPSNSRVLDQESFNSSKFDGRRWSRVEKVWKEDEDGRKALNSQGTDLIGDSLPKEVPETESFFMVSAPQKVILTQHKKEGNNVAYLEKREKTASQSFPKEKHFSTVQKLENFPKANENDQNQLNAAFETTKSRTWMKADESPLMKGSIQSRQKLCIVASSVRNLDMIKKFVAKFKMEYLNKATKNMTHLVVGLHENEEEGDVLPLCTPKFLFAMANRKWIVTEAWAETCLNMETIVPEEPFEALDPAGGHGCRNARLSTQPLLKDCEIYLLGSFSAISKEDFAGLILDCGGTVIQKPEQFSFSPLKLRMIVADQDCLNMDWNQLKELHERYSTVILSRDVILMSIQNYKLANFTPHLLHATSEEELMKMGYPSQLVRFDEEETNSNWNNSK